MDEDKNRRITVLKSVIFIMAIAYLTGNWIATQIVAYECNFNTLLGDNLTLGTVHIYPPYGFYIWSNNVLIAQAIPYILNSVNKYIIISLIVGAFISYLKVKSSQNNISHGSASFATAKDIDKTGLGEYEIKETKRHFLFFSFKTKGKIIKDSGVVVGINPFTNKLMLDNAVTHMLLIAPTRSGKGVNTIIPTGVVWKHSIFFFDVKGELWQATAGYRQKILHQKVMKFEPLCTDGSTARWNPFAEINFRTTEELNDIATIVGMLVKPDGEKQGGGDPFWDNSATALLNGVIMHLMYKNYKEGRPLPCLTDVMSFLSSPDKSVDELFQDMLVYPHISPEEFLELEYEDTDTHEKKHYTNPLKEIYGEYIKNFQPFNEFLNPEKPIKNLDDLRREIIKNGNISFDPPEDAEESNIFSICLTNPKVAECASNMLNGAEQTRASIMQTAQTCMAIYQDPVVQRNTAVSDFAIRDLLDPKQEVSLYMCMAVKDLDTLRPLSRLFINTLLSKLIRDMKFEKDQEKMSKNKQRLLLMLDEFPQLKNLKSVESALAVCAGYGIKMCIVAQDVNQLNKEYTKDNSIASNCHVHTYFTPNLDTNGSATAEAISKALGKKTISTVNHSDGGGGFLKGSNSSSYMARDLMTADEVSHMSQNREIVFVAGHKPILSQKLKYYEIPYFMNKILPCPLFSDKVTIVKNYNDLFAVHAADVKAAIEKRNIVSNARAQINNKGNKNNDMEKP